MKLIITTTTTTLLVMRLIPLLLCYISVTTTTALPDNFNRHRFPPTFIFGAGTSAYQVEGAAFEDGRTASTADFALSGKTGNYSKNGNVSGDEYHKYKDDVQLMVETGLDAYRFSISWSRLLPSGREPVNPKGLAYYNNLIDELISNGIQPHVTLLHFDVPLILENEYGGFTNPKIIEDFTAYANVCFREFGDRVQHWMPINEVNLFAELTYPVSLKLPYPRRSRLIKWTDGNVIAKSYDKYQITHHALLAHASSVRLYKERYQAKQRGFIGVNLFAMYYTPFSNSTEDIMAIQRSYDHLIDWVVHPLMYGDYPETVKKAVGVDLPVFTESDSNLVKGTFDFIGLNYYATVFTKDDPSTPYVKASWTNLDGYDYLKGDPIPNTPWGLRGVLEHFKHAYNNPPIFIHENGQLTNYTLSDLSRVEYIRDHIGSLLDAFRNGSNVRGYFVWSFIDMVEYLYGYEKCFGLYYVDYNDPIFPRYPKLSQKWYSNFLRVGNETLIAEI